MNTYIKYIGAALPTNAAGCTLFSTVDTFPMAQGLQMTNTHRVTIDIFSDKNGTANYYKSMDRGVNWVQIGTASTTGSGTASSTLDILLQEYADFKVTWTPASDTTVFKVDISLSSQRPVGA